MNEMMNPGEHELIIVRRRPDTDAFAGKSGVWKIAHADFMTAMMAFFLVMWLVSSTDEASRSEIAQYFNPVKLAEMSEFEKGISNPKPKASGADGADVSQAVKDGSSYATQNISSEIQKFGEAGNRTFEQGAKASETLPTYTEAEIFSDPYGVLNRIMMSANLTQELDAAAAEGTAGTEARLGSKGGAALRDPFDPLYWRLQPDQTSDTPLSEKPTETTEVAANEVAEAQPPRPDPFLGVANPLDGLITGPDPVDHLAMGPAADTQSPDMKDAAEASTSLLSQAESTAPESPLVGDGPSTGTKVVTDATANPENATLAMASSEKNAADTTDETAKPDQTTNMAETSEAAPSKLLEEYRVALKAELDKAPKLDIEDAVTVKDSGSGLLIDVTDSPTWGMFAVGSSEPSARSIALLEKIARSLSTIEGKVIIRGHTDGRPFRGGEYDNWRLSTARAHMARFMLIRGGLDEKRLLRVEGYADQQLKHPGNPEADDNRRIEILVQPTAGTEQ